MLNKALNIFFWILLIFVWIILSGHVLNYYDSLKLKKIEINLIDDNFQNFITKSEIKSIISSLGIIKNVT